MTELTLIQCTNAKRDETSFARNLYDASAYYRKMRAWAQSRDCEWRILSAKHGLLHPDATIRPYDQRGLTESQAEEIAASLSSQGVTTVYVCAGRDYLDSLVPALEARGVEVIDNFAGMRIGERMSELEART